MLVVSPTDMLVLPEGSIDCLRERFDVPGYAPLPPLNFAIRRARAERAGDALAKGTKALRPMRSRT